jgi:hypothetical protein
LSLSGREKSTRTSSGISRILSFHFIIKINIAIQCFAVGVEKNGVMGKKKPYQEKKWLNVIYCPHASRVMKYSLFKSGLY